MRSAPLLLLLAVAGLTVAAAAPPSRNAERGPRTVAATPSGPPHAWLFGTWTGGLFPVLDGMLAQDCRTQATVAFAQDVVGHTSLFLWL